MNKTHSPALRKAEPVPRPLAMMTEADLDERERRLLDAIAEMMAARPPKALLDTNGLGQLLGVSPAIIRRLIDDGMPFIKLGEMRRYDGDAVLEWLRQRTEAEK